MRRARWGWGWLLLLVLGVIGALIHSNGRAPTLETPAAAPAQTLLSTPNAETPAARPKAAEPERVVAKTVYVKADTLNVRSSPSTSASVLLRLSRGAAIQVRYRSGDWYGVQMTNGAVGWLHGAYLTENAAAQPTELVARTPEAPATPAYNRDEVVQAIIGASLNSYPGRCPCPYNTMRNGRRCGGSSAYSKPGGRSPICYPEDVTERMIAEYISRR